MMFSLCSALGWYPDAQAIVELWMMLSAVFKPLTLGQRMTMALRTVWSSWSSGTGKGPIPSACLLPTACWVPAGTKTLKSGTSRSSRAPGPGNSKGTRGGGDGVRPVSTPPQSTSIPS